MNSITGRLSPVFGELSCFAAVVEAVVVLGFADVVFAPLSDLFTDVPSEAPFTELRPAFVVVTLPFPAAVVFNVVPLCFVVVFAVVVTFVVVIFFVVVDVVVVVIVVEVVVGFGFSFTHTDGDTCMAVCILSDEPLPSA